MITKCDKHQNLVPNAYPDVYFTIHNDSMDCTLTYEDVDVQRLISEGTIPSFAIYHALKKFLSYMKEDKDFFNRFSGVQRIIHIYGHGDLSDTTHKLKYKHMLASFISQFTTSRNTIVIVSHTLPYPFDEDYNEYNIMNIIEAVAGFFEYRNFRSLNPHLEFTDLLSYIYINPAAAPFIKSAALMEYYDMVDKIDYMNIAARKHNCDKKITDWYKE